MNKKPNIEGILKHSQEKSAITSKKVEKAIQDLIKQKGNINFNSIATKANVSKSFLYNHPVLRDRIEHLRKQQVGLKTIKNVKRKTTDSSKDVIIETLKNKNKQLRKENVNLKLQLEKYLNKMYEDI